MVLPLVAATEVRLGRQVVLGNAAVRVDQVALLQPVPLHIQLHAVVAVFPIGGTAVAVAASALAYQGLEAAVVLASGAQPACDAPTVLYLGDQDVAAANFAALAGNFGLSFDLLVLPCGEVEAYFE